MGWRHEIDKVAKNYLEAEVPIITSECDIRLSMNAHGGVQIRQAVDDPEIPDDCAW